MEYHSENASAKALSPNTVAYTMASRMPADRISGRGLRLGSSFTTDKDSGGTA